jgi:POT family proton-dependent oligopeptide transporter
MLQRHPIGLYILFFVEMWERFGFYCMLAIFKLYMTDPEHPYDLLRQNSNQIYGLYLGGTYFTPFFGGILADWKLGYRLSVTLGAIFFVTGYFLLGAEGLPYFFAGLTLLIVGNGLFKPNISTMVGKLYPQGDPRIDSAFTIFYMGINIGAFLSPIVAGAIASRAGYHAAFQAAGVGMLVSLATFLFLQGWIREAPTSNPRADSVAPSVDISREIQARRNLALLIFFGINILFWMAFKQNGNALAVFARDYTDRVPPPWLAEALHRTGLAHVLLDKEGKEFPAALQASINPFYVIVFSPLMVAFWQSLRKRNLEPATPGKLVLGFGLCTLAFLFIGGVWRAAGEGRLSPLVLLGTYALITLAELCLSPMGLSLVSKLAHPRTRAVWMGGFFVSTAIGGYLSGAVGHFWDKWSSYPERTQFFFLLAGSSFLAMLLMLASYRVIASALPQAKSAN